MEDEVIEAFLARIQSKADAMALRPPDPLAKPQLPAWVLPATVAACVPIVGLAGYFAGWLGIAMAFLGISGITKEYLKHFHK